MKTREELIRNYDLLAEEYARVYVDELESKPFDRELLRRFIRNVPWELPICDLGCGPGHLTGYLSSLGVDAMGIDLSPGMIAVARRLFPSVDYRVGDMLGLDLPAGMLGGVVAFYAIIHLRRDQIDNAFSETFRVLRHGGGVLVSFHVGEGALHEEESLGRPIAFDCTLFEPEEVVEAITGAGFAVEEVAARKPYDFEYPTTRTYVWGTKPLEAA